MSSVKISDLTETTTLTSSDYIIVDNGSTTKKYQANNLINSQMLSSYRTSAQQDVIDNGKQATISDLATIRSGASLGATALQSVPSEYITETELQQYHDSSKQNTLVSGTNIKTINNYSLLGSGNITISGGGGGSALKCHFTYNQEEYSYVCDKTFNEVKTAIQGGNSVVAYGQVASSQWCDVYAKDFIMSSASYRDNVPINDDGDYREVIEFSMPWGKIIGQYGQVSVYSLGQTYVLWTRLKVPDEGDYGESIIIYDQVDGEQQYAVEAGWTSGENYERFQVDTGGDGEKLCKQFISGKTVHVSNTDGVRKSSYVPVTCQNSTMDDNMDVKCYVGNVTTCWPTLTMSGSTANYTFTYYLYTMIVEQHTNYDTDETTYYLVLKTKQLS